MALTLPGCCNFPHAAQNFRLCAHSIAAQWDKSAFASLGSRGVSPAAPSEVWHNPLLRGPLRPHHLSPLFPSPHCSAARGGRWYHDYLSLEPGVVSAFALYPLATFQLPVLASFWLIHHVQFLDVLFFWAEPWQAQLLKLEPGSLLPALFLVFLLAGTGMRRPSWRSRSPRKAEQKDGRSQRTQPSLHPTSAFISTRKTQNSLVYTTVRS